MGYFAGTVVQMPYQYFYLVSVYFKVLIITDFGQRQNQHKVRKIQSIFPKLYRCLLYVAFHNLEPQDAGLVDIQKDLNKKRPKGIFMRENLTNKHRY